MTTEKNHSEAFTEVFTSVVDAFNLSGNNALSFYKNEFLVSQTAALIAKHGVEGQLAAPIGALLARFDFRLIADYFNIPKADSSQKNQFDKILDGDTAAYYEYQIAKFLGQVSSAALTSSDAPQPVAQLKELFVDEAQGRRLVYFYDKSAIINTAPLFSDIRNHVGEFFDSQPELPSVSARAREGLVRSFVLPNGRTVISKRSNPKKNGRFRVEQENIQALISKLDLPLEESAAEIGVDSCGKRILVRLIRPFAVLTDPGTNAFYSLSNFVPHLTLEQALLREKDAQQRQTHLSNCRKLLDYFYAQGIVWFDMAPRNILVEQSETATTYHVLDFEKTDIRPEPIPVIERQEHCRGLMSIEEFGAVCSREEVAGCFAGYFDPDDGGVQSSSLVLPREPTSEVVTILNGRGKTPFTPEDYYQAEQEINGVRFPYFDSKGERRFPIQVSFKIDHYYGSEYDRRATEVFLAAKHFGCLEDIQNWLELVLGDQDSKKLFSVFFDNSYAGNRGNMDRLIKETLDNLYAVRTDQHLFERTIEKMNISHALFSIRQEAVLKPFSGRELAAKNTALIATCVSGLLEATTERFGGQDYLIFIGGSYARGECTVGSDLDVGVVAEQVQLGKQIEQFILSYATERLPVPIELFPLIQIDHFDEFLNANPGYFAEFTWAKVVGGNDALIERFHSIRGARLANENFKKKALVFYQALSDGIDAQNPKALLKQFKWDRALVPQQILSDDIVQRLNQQLDVVLFLKNEDESTKLGFASGFVPVSDFLTVPFMGKNSFSPETPRLIFKNMSRKGINQIVDPG